MRPQIWPRPTSKETPSSATMPPKRTQRSRTLRSALPSLAVRSGVTATTSAPLGGDPPRPGFGSHTRTRSLPDTHLLIRSRFTRGRNINSRSPARAPRRFTSPRCQVAIALKVRQNPPDQKRAKPWPNHVPGPLPTLSHALILPSAVLKRIPPHGSRRRHPDGSDRLREHRRGLDLRAGARGAGARPRALPLSAAAPEPQGREGHRQGP